MTITQPIKLTSGKVLDGNGDTITVAAGATVQSVFDASGSKGATVTNFKIDAGQNTSVLAGGGFSGLIATNITGISCNSGVNIHDAEDVTLTDFNFTTVNRYGFYADRVKGLTLTRYNVTEGSKLETSVRLMDDVEDAVLDSCHIANLLNKRTALRTHMVTNLLLTGCSIYGWWWVGPMSGNDGGEKTGWRQDAKGVWVMVKPGEKDYAGWPWATGLVERRRRLAWKAVKVRAIDCYIEGQLGGQAGLTDFAMKGGSIAAVATAPFGGHPLGQTTWSYPNPLYAINTTIEGNDPTPRGQPQGVLIDVKIVAPGQTTLDYEKSNGPFATLGVTLNDKPFPDTKGATVPADLQDNAPTGQSSAPTTPVTPPATKPSDLLTATWYDVKTGKTRPITNDPVKLSSVGTIPTVRATTFAKAVMFDLTLNGKTVANVPTEDLNPPFTLGGDAGIAGKVPPGVYTLKMTPCDGKTPTGPSVTVTLNIAAETPAASSAPAPAKPAASSSAAASVPKDVTSGTGTGQPVQSKLTFGPNGYGDLIVGAGDLTALDYTVLKDHLKKANLTSTRVWQNSNGFGTYKRPGDAVHAVEYESNGVHVRWVVAQSKATPEMAKNAPAYMVKFADDLVSIYDDPKNPGMNGREIVIIYGNEPDLSAEVLEANGKGTGVMEKVYWTGTIDSYVASLVAVCAAVHAKHGTRVKVFAAGFSWDIGTLEYVGGTIAKSADGFCYHGYPPALDAANMNRYVRFGALCKKYKLPGIIDEASPGFGKDVKAGKKTVADDWAPGWVTYINLLKTLGDGKIGLTEIIMFNGILINSTNGAGSMFDKHGVPTVCFNTIATALAAK